MTKYNLSAQPKRYRKQSSYDPEKIFIHKAGKDINVYDMIQEASEDTDIYKTLEKYGTIDSMYKYDKAVYGEFEELMSLTDVLEINRKANQLWEQLPAGVREQFHNNPEELIKNGETWLKNELAKNQPQPEPEPIKPSEGDNQ